MKKREVKKVVEPIIILEPIDIVKKFITDNGLDFSGSGSDLNGNCVILAGFICYVTIGSSGGRRVVFGLDLPSEAEEELLRVFDYAYNNDYSTFWDTPEAREKYKF